MAVDRPDSGAEAVERQQAVEAPPPPPDRPGDEDFPSRAESRAAAAAPDTDQRQLDLVDDKPDASARDTAGEERDTTLEESTESSTSPEHDEVPAHENSAWDSPDEDDHESAEKGTQQRSSLEKALRAEAVDDERAPVNTSAETEAIDRRASSYGDGADAGEQPAPIDAPPETSDEQRPDDVGPPSDLPGAEPEEVPSQSESGTYADAVVAADTGQVNDTADVESTDRISDVRQAAEPPGDLPGSSLDTADRPGNDELPVPDVSTITVRTEVDDRTQDREPRPRAEPTEGAHFVDEATLDYTQDIDDPAERPDTRVDGSGAAEVNDTGPAMADGSEISAQRSERPDQNAAESTPPRIADVEDSTENQRAGVGDTNHDQVAGGGRVAAEAGDFEEPPELPAGKELLEMEGDDEPRVDRLRRKTYERLDDLFDVTAEVAEEADGIFHRPPTDSHAVVKIDHTVMEAPHQGIHVGEAATALLATGIVIAEISRWSYGKMSGKERT